MGAVYLILSITCSSTINLLFRSFKSWEVHKLSAIVINYLVCFLLGYAISDHENIFAFLSQDWFVYCLVLGFFFVGIFMAMAYTADKLGASVTAVSSKMSVVIPVCYLAFIANEDIGIVYIVGFVFALLSIYFISVKKTTSFNKRYFALPIIVFLGGGIIDISMKVLEQSFAAHVSLNTITYSIFLGAFIAGLFLYLFLMIMKKAPFIRTKDLGAGIVLGLPNYFSILFLFLALDAFTQRSSIVFGINNVGIVLLTTLLAILIFKEEINTKNKIGLILAILAICLISFGGR